MKLAAPEAGESPDSPPKLTPSLRVIGGAQRHRQLFAREPEWQFSLMLVLEVIFVFGAMPMLSASKADRGILMLLQLILAGTAIALLAKSTWLRLALTISFGLSLIVRVGHGLMPQTLTISTIFAYNLLVTNAMSRAVFGAGPVTYHRIAGAVFIYLNIALLFALAYDELTRALPDALSGLSDAMRGYPSEMIHFSFTTLTGIGDGPVLPHSPLARSLADLETVVGHLFPAILLARLVGLHVSEAR